MLICYLDESGNTGRRLDDPAQPLHSIAAVLLREDRIRTMTDRLDALAAAAPTQTPLLEYRGYEMFSGAGSWKGVHPHQRIEEYAKALSVLGEVEASVAYASINKPQFAAKGYEGRNPHLYALQFLTEKIQRWVAGQTDPLSQRVLLVADENHEQEQYAIDLIRTMQATGGPVGGWAGLAIPLDNYVDSVYFARSDQNRGIQLADLVAFIINRSQRIHDHPSDQRSDGAVMTLLQNHIDPQIRTYRTSWP